MFRFTILPMLVASPILVFAQTSASAHESTAAPPALVAGIDIGSKGVRGVVVEIHSEAGQTKMTHRFAKSVNTTIIQGVEQTGKLDARNISETVDQVVRMRRIIVEEYGIAPEKIEIVASSGVAMASNKDELAQAVKEHLKTALTFFTYEVELKRVFFGTVPAEHVNEAILYDQGSGDTKAIAFGDRRVGNHGWYVSQQYRGGTVTFAARIDQAAQAAKIPFTTQLRQYRPTLEQQLTDVADQNPTIQHNRQRVYLTGGIVWAMASVLHPEQVHEPMVRLDPADFDRFLDLLYQTPDAFPIVDLTRIENNKQRAAAEKELNRVRDVFTLKQLLAGTELLRAAAKANRFHAKELSFARNGVFAWVLGKVQEDAFDAVGPQTVYPRYAPRTGLKLLMRRFQ